jgi:[ribosomal protein S5]-alanine N-acetyltransferase
VGPASRPVVPAPLIRYHHSMDRWLPFESERLLMREFRESDFDSIRVYAADPEVSRYMQWGPNDKTATRVYLDARLEAQKLWPRPSVEFGVELKSEGRLIGGLRLALQDDEGKTADFGYTYDRRYWRKGYATEAAQALLTVAFERLHLHRVWATCDTRNAGSLGVMRKLGMRHEGTFRQDVWQKGEWRDTHLCAILAKEWARRT